MCYLVCRYLENPWSPAPTTMTIQWWPHLTTVTIVLGHQCRHWQQQRRDPITIDDQLCQDRWERKSTDIWWLFDDIEYKDNMKQLILVHTASISQCFMTKHCKKIEERDTLLFTILFNKKDKYHTSSFLSFFLSRHDLRSFIMLGL